MMPAYSYRPYRPGDEIAINELYALITGRQRSKEAYLWQWLKAPGGMGEIWLIEVDRDDKGKKLIGHHGVMPIRFSNGTDDLLFGKTENTFVHPDFRSKILYPRFERRFRGHYEQRFHSLFSTMGPGEAIRQRQAQGYQASATWMSFSWTVRPWNRLLYLGSRLTARVSPQISKFSFPIPKAHPSYLSTRIGGVNVNCYDSKEALGIEFLGTFWPSIRGKYNITPSRNYEDLRWRFWENPYGPHFTLVLDSVVAGAGVAILSYVASGTLRIEDFFVEKPRSRSFRLLLEAILGWAAEQRAHTVQFITTDDSINWIGESNFNPRKNLFGQQILKRWRKLPGVRMPRKICNSGKDLGLEDCGWYITPIVFEGIHRKKLFGPG